MTRDEKIEDLAEEMYAAMSFSEPWDMVEDWGQKGFIRAATVAQDRIDAAGVVWTRVEDGLPKPDRKVQLTVQYEDGARAVRVTCYRSRDEGWDGVGTYVRPLAWAPLPEPWRG